MSTPRGVPIEREGNSARGGRAIRWMLVFFFLAAASAQPALAIDCSDLGGRIKERIDAKAAEHAKQDAAHLAPEAPPTDAVATAQAPRSGFFARALLALKAKWQRTREFLTELTDPHETFPRNYHYDTETKMNERFAKQRWFEAYRAGHQTARFLEKLGVVFDETNNIIRVPPTETLFANLTRVMHEAGYGKILRPARLYRGKDNEIVAVPLGAEASAGLMPVWDLLPTAEFAKVVASGYFPISSTATLNSHTTNFLHDLAHFAAFVASPEYGKGFHEAYKYLAEHWSDYTRLTGNNDNPFVFAPEENSLPKNSPLLVRSFYATEMAGLVPPEQVSKFGLLLPPLENPNDHYTVAATRVYLEKRNLTSDQIKNKLADIVKKLPSYELYLGGVAGDLFTIRSVMAGDLHRPGYANTLGGLANIAEQLSLPRWKALLKTDSGGAGLLREDPLTVLAKLQVAIVESSKLKPGDWVREAHASHPKDGTPLQDFIAKTGLFTMKDNEVEAHLDRDAQKNVTAAADFGYNANWRDEQKPPSMTVTAEEVGKPVAVGHDYMYFPVSPKNGTGALRFFPISSDIGWVAKARKVVGEAALAKALGVDVERPPREIRLKMPDRPAMLGVLIPENAVNPATPEQARDARIVRYLATGERSPSLDAQDGIPSPALLKALENAGNNTTSLLGPLAHFSPSEFGAVRKRMTEVLDAAAGAQELASAENAVVDKDDAIYERHKASGLPRSQFDERLEEARRIGLSDKQFDSLIDEAVAEKRKEEKEGCAVR